MGPASKAVRNRRDPVVYAFLLGATLSLLSLAGTEWEIAVLRFKLLKILTWIFPAACILVAHSWKSGFKYALFMLLVCIGSVWWMALKIEILTDQVIGNHWKLSVPVLIKTLLNEPMRLALLYVAIPSLLAALTLKVLFLSLRRRP